MTLRTVQEAASAYAEDGAGHHAFLYKPSIPSAVTAGSWIDASMSSGTPKYNAYVGVQLEGTPLTGAGNSGIYVGPAPEAGKTKHLLSAQFGMSAAVPSTIQLCDYLLFYPLVDGDSIDLQEMDNGVATLPRYSTGTGVRAMLVWTTPGTANGTYTLTYTNSDGVSGRTTTGSILTSTVTGVLGGCAGSTAAINTFSPFLPLAEGDSGIRSIQSIQLNTPVGGFFALVLVKPVAQVQVYEAATRSEVVYVHDRFVIPKIESGAYLNLILSQGAASAVQLLAELVFINK